MKKRLLFFIGTLNDGGAQRVVSIISSKMAERGYDVEVLKYYDTENIYQLNKKVKINSIVKQTKTRNLFINIVWLHNYFRKNADCIISFLAPFNIVALLANVGNKVPIIVSDRNDPKKVPNNILIRKLRNILYKTADNIVVQNKSNAVYFNNSNCVIIENPFNDKEYIGRALNSKKENRIVSVGRLCEQKNQLMLIKAFFEVMDKYVDYKLEIYGDYEPYKEILEKEIIQLGLNNKVFLIGSQNDILKKISSAKLFVLTSNYEGMPNALIEAMCLGLPCISTKFSGIEDIINNGINGILIDINDINGLAKSIIAILDNDEKRNTISRNATKIASKYDSDIIANKWIQLIENV